MLHPDTMIPDLLDRHPNARAVLDRYGLRGCGGRLGPVESLAFFARTHGVDQAHLLAEIQQAIDNPKPAARPLAPSVADTIYRRFFITGIIVILTAGATWGAWLLWRIAVGGSFTGISIHDVNAHGHAQIFGWVALFIMGFAYQAFPRIWHTDLAAPRLAVAAFLLMLAGLVARTAGMTLAESWSAALSAAMLGGAMEIAAVLIFAGQILLTFRRSGARLEPYVGFVIAALGFFIAMTVMCVWHTFNTMSATSRDALLWYVATYQAPLRDIQIHGLAMFMILGVSLRMLPALFGVSAIRPARAWWALGILLTAVLGEFALFIAYRWTMNHALAAALLIPWLMLTIGVAMIALPWKLWRPLPESDRSGKFVRAAYAWLGISLIMLLLLPAYQALSGIAFSHAFYGAIRHAITVGFISLMIMGFAAKVVPTLNGIDTRTLSPLWGPFILINVGCFLRVFLQTLTDFVPGAFALVGISGTLEVAALAWWGAGLIAIMLRGRRAERELEQEAASPAPARIEPEHRVSDVLHWFPHTQDVFDLYGFTLLRNPIARRTIARGVTIAKAAAFKGVELEDLLGSLNRRVRGLTVIDSGTSTPRECGLEPHPTSDNPAAAASPAPRFRECHDTRAGTRSPCAAETPPSHRRRESAAGPDVRRR